MKKSLSPLSPIAGLLILLGSFTFFAFSKVDDPFYNKASQANLAEIKAGQLAVEKGSAKVKALGRQMVADHTKAEDELVALSKKANLTIAMAPDDMHKQAVADMSKLSQNAFDSAYVASQLKDHQDAVALFSDEAASGPDANAKAYAAKYLPKLQDHLKMFQGDSSMNMK